MGLRSPHRSPTPRAHTTGEEGAPAYAGDTPDESRKSVARNSILGGAMAKVLPNGPRKTIVKINDMPDQSTGAPGAGSSRASNSAPAGVLHSALDQVCAARGAGRGGEMGARRAGCSVWARAPDVWTHVLSSDVCRVYAVSAVCAAAPARV